MTDALDALGLPVEPIDPDPEFAARLRGQLQDALLTTTPTTTIGGDMTQEITYTQVAPGRDRRGCLGLAPDADPVHLGPRRQAGDRLVRRGVRRSAREVTSTRAQTARSGTPSSPSATPC